MSQPDVSTCPSSILQLLRERLPLGWLWRRSPLGPLQTVVILLQMTAFGTRGYRKAMAALFEDVHQAWGWDSVPSSAAFCKARRKHSPESLRTLFTELRTACTHIDSHRQLSLAGMGRIVCVDGTKLTLSSQGTNKQDFGCPSGEHLAPQAMLTVLWDAGGNAPVDWRAGRYDSSETGHLLAMFDSLRADDLLLGDRLYASRELLHHFMSHQRHFIFRIKTKGRGCANEFKDFVASDDVERIVEIPQENGGESCLVRLVRSQHTGAQDMVFVTSLTDSDCYSAQAIGDLYHRRWVVETAYRESKDWLAFKALPGQNQEQIQQEITAVMIYWLMQAELEGQTRKAYAKEIARQKPVPTAHRAAEEITELPVTFPRTLAHSFISSILRVSLRDPTETLVVWREAISYLWRNRQRRRPGRSYRRTSQRPHDLKKRDALARSQARGGRAPEGQ